MWIAWNRPSSRTDRVIYFVLSTSFIHSLTTMRCGRWDNNAAIEQLPRSRSRHQLQTVIGKEGIRGLVSAVVESVRLVRSFVGWFWFQTYRAQRRRWRTAACLLWHARRPTRYEPRTIRPTDPATPIAVIHSFSRPVFAWSLPETNRSFVRSFVE